MDRIILGVITAVLAVFSYSLWDKNQDLEQEVKRGKISIDSTMLSKATEFTFMKVENQFTYYMKEKNIGPKNGKWEALYTWSYPFNFGYKIEDNWDWCINVDQEEGVISINAPKITQLNRSDASPKAEKIFNGGFKATQVAAQEWMVETANKKMKDTASRYLENTTVQESVKKSLSSFFREILNDAHEGENPINEVIVNITDDSTCNAANI
ncbi:hypothetical protein [Microbulbifer sp. HZ11]|uniref:hypothetical protein n=1 Tax=Microbulbifer sp. HZ11 TaxID=1453501 RepID=UPI0005BE6CEF|nr:hypothetical protein [Microbulbifer sp. HZ11]